MSVTKMQYTNGSLPILNLMSGINSKLLRDKIELDPDYQRGFIWSNEFKDKLFYSIVKGYPIGNISLRNTEKNGIPFKEVVDGKQRLQSIVKFINGEYEIKSDMSKKIIQYILSIYEESKSSSSFSSEEEKCITKLSNKLKNKGKPSIKFIDFPDFIQQKFNSYNIAITYLSNCTDEEIREYFTYLQNQERLRAGEIINSVDYSYLETFLEKIDVDSLLKIFKFKNNRDQFKRVFYSIVGLIDDKISFGVTDKVVIKYASECKGVSPITNDRISNLIKQINVINKNALNWEVPNGFNVRALKFFILLACFNYVDFSQNTTEKLKQLDSINQKLSSFSSAKIDSVDQSFEGYTKDVIEEYRLVALVQKGGHSISRVQNRMEILAYYINHFNDINIYMLPSKIKAL